MDYQRVRFIGYAIPTTPAEMVPIGDPNGSGAVAGTYRAHDDFERDISTRAGLLKVAVDAARSEFADSGDGVLNVFVAPEFFWHSAMGPYVHGPTEPDPVDRIMELLEDTFPADAYPDFLLVLGTAISAQIGDVGTVLSAASTRARNEVVRALGDAWQIADGPLKAVVFDNLVNFIKNCHAYPMVEVRNRALILGPDRIEGVTGAIGSRAVTTEKYFDSNEDLVLWDVTGRPVITEQMSAYPIIDISDGDFKTSARDPHAIFRLGGSGQATVGEVTVGVEICLDHADHRMRKAIARSPWPHRDGGIDLHLIPSCGMQLHSEAVAARAGGWAFNCDGQYALGDGAEAGAVRRDVVGGVVPSVGVDYVAPANRVYGAHTQLAGITAAPYGADLYLPESRDAELGPAPIIDVTVLPIQGPPDLAACFAGGAGAVHIYGAADPLPLPSSRCDDAAAR